MRIKIQLSFLLSHCLTMFALISPQAQGAEVDNFGKFSERNKLENARPMIEAKSYQLLDEALAEANLKSEAGCEEDRLYSEIRSRFGNHVFSEIGKWLYKTDEYPKHDIPFEETVYYGFSIFESFMLSQFLQVIRSVTPLEVQIASVVNYDGYYFGIDKFEHFWATGRSYFEKAYLGREDNEAPDYDKALRNGEFKERTVLGRMTTGIYSYADLAANLDGMRFWNNILAKEKDFLGLESPKAPYVKCENNTWKIRNYPDWTFYMSEAWNESFNCSKFRKNSMRDKVEEKLLTLEAETGVKHNCPVQSEKISSLEQRYSSPFMKNLSERILNFENTTFEEDWIEANPPRARMRSNPKFNRRSLRR